MICEPFTAIVEDQRLVITIGREFDSGLKRDTWTQQIMAKYRFTYQAVIVDLAQVIIISSTVIAGLVQLHDHYWRDCPEGVILRHPSAHVLKILDMMKLRHLFQVQAANA